MKLFTMIKGEELSATKEKIIPADEFSTLLEGRELIEKIKEEAEIYRREVVEEGEQLKEEAQKEGFQEGLEKFNQQIAHLEEEIARVEEKIEKKLTSIAVQAAKKVVGRELESDPTTIADIVRTSLRAVAGHKKVTIYCNRQDHEELEKNKAKLSSAFERLESLAIVEREDVEPGGCVIETEAGIINAQWENQWRALEAALQKILEG